MSSGLFCQKYIITIWSSYCFLRHLLILHWSFKDIFPPLSATQKDPVANLGMTCIVRQGFRLGLGGETSPWLVSRINVLFFCSRIKGSFTFLNHIVSVSKQFDCMANGLPHSELMNEILAALSHLQYFDNPNWCRTLCMNSIKSSRFRNSKLIS